MNVVHLAQVRDLAVEWEKVRVAVGKGAVRGFYLCLLTDADKETIYSGGVYKASPQMAARAALRISAARVLEEDQAPAAFNDPAPARIAGPH